MIKCSPEHLVSKKLYLIASLAPWCENPASVVCAHCECKPGGGKVFLTTCFDPGAHHFVVIVEAEEPLEILPICLNYII